MGFFSSLTKMAMDVVETPVALIKDIATLGGALTDEEEPYTAKKLKDIQQDWDSAKESLDGE